MQHQSLLEQMQAGCKLTPFVSEQLGAFVLMQDDCFDFTV